MSVLHRLALRIGWQLARHPATHAKAAQALGKTERLLRDDIAPRVQRAWQDAQPKITHAKHRLTRTAKQLRDEYRKGRGGQ
jgi:hypothetical protein